MGYRDSYLWRLRQAVGNDLVLNPNGDVTHCFALLSLRGSGRAIRGPTGRSRPT